MFGIACMIVGMESIPCGSDDKHTKKRIRLVGGCLGFLSGMLLVAAVSWYANDVRIQHEFATQQRLVGNTSVNRYIFGEGLFIGWVGGAFLVIAGLLGICTGCGGESYEDGPRSYVYRPPKSAGTGQEYV
uniref:Claudin-1 n=1 Tax=Phallusia mammillata TaxID=59560 RepID=A0A6F9D8W5_9ASCI|nr:claudin-1 [Phallusia mammillata]